MSVIQHQVVDMDQRAGSTISQKGFNVFGAGSGDPGGIARSVGRDAAADGPAVGIQNADRVTALETALDTGQSDGKQGFAGAKGRDGPRINPDRSVRTDRSGSRLRGRGRMIGPGGTRSRA